MVPIGLNRLADNMSVSTRNECGSKDPLSIEISGLTCNVHDCQSTKHCGRIDYGSQHEHRFESKPMNIVFLHLGESKNGSLQFAFKFDCKAQNFGVG